MSERKKFPSSLDSKKPIYSLKKINTRAKIQKVKGDILILFPSATFVRGNYFYKFG